MESFSKFLQEDELGVKAVSSENYGQELILDIHDVPPDFFNRIEIRHFAEKLCDEIKMKRGPLYSWGMTSQEHKAEKGEAAIKADGISCIQFLYKSSITMHCLDEINKVFINIFSCETFSTEKAIKFVEEFVGGKIVYKNNIIRH